MKIGRVYKIIHNQSDLVYIGSTFDKLRQRFYNHKINKKSLCIISKYINQYEAKNFKIMLIKEYKVVDRKHLRSKEQLWINKLRCINKNNAIPFLWKKILDKIYRKENKEKINNLTSKWRKENKNYLKEYRKNHYHKNKEKNTLQNKIYRENNREKIKEIHKRYREKNKEKIRENTKQKVKCNVCDCMIRKCGIRRHEKSKKHINNLK